MNPLAPIRQTPARTPVGLAALLLVVYGVSATPLVKAPAPPLERDQLCLRIDPNTATAHELELLPGIGPTLARRICEQRTQAAPAAFSTAEDLARVHGIGPATVARLRPLLRFLPASRNQEPVTAP
jgi:competence protein ComEA